MTRSRWFLVNYGILYAIAFVGGWLLWIVQPDPAAGIGDWILAPLGLALAGVILTSVLSIPLFTVYLVALYRAKRRWPYRRTAWALSPLLGPGAAAFYGNGNDWWVPLIVTACIPVAAQLVRV